MLRPSPSQTMLLARLSPKPAQDSQPSMQLSHRRCVHWIALTPPPLRPADTRSILESGVCDRRRDIPTLIQEEKYASQSHSDPVCDIPTHRPCRNPPAPAGG